MVSSPVGPEVDIAPPTNAPWGQQSARTAFDSNKPAGWFDWPPRVKATAAAECRRRGYDRAVNAAIVPIYYDASGNVVDHDSGVNYHAYGTAG